MDYLLAHERRPRHALILRRASEGFGLSAISHTIFELVFESALNSDTRRSDGMYDTFILTEHK